MREDAASSKGYYLHNGHGDVVGIRNVSGAVVNEYEYDLWGKPLVTVEGVDNPFRYSGEYWDKSSDLRYLRARWYDPGMGRFISEDTYEGELGNPLSQNLYTYVHNNPLFCFLRGELKDTGISNKSAKTVYLYLFQGGRFFVVLCFVILYFTHSTFIKH